MTVMRYEILPNSKSGMFKFGGSMGVHLARSPEDAIELIKLSLGEKFEEWCPDGVSARAVDEGKYASIQAQEFVKGMSTLLQAQGASPMLYRAIVMAMVQSELMAKIRHERKPAHMVGEEFLEEVGELIIRTVTALQVVEDEKDPKQAISKIFRSMGVNVAELPNEEMEIFRDKDLPEPGAANPSSPWKSQSEVRDEIPSDTEKGRP